MGQGDAVQYLRSSPLNVDVRVGETRLTPAGDPEPSRGGRHERGFQIVCHRSTPCRRRQILQSIRADSTVAGPGKGDTMPTTQRPRRELASPAQIADLFGLDTKTVRRRIADGTLPAFRVGRQIRIDVAAAEAALMRPMNEAAAALLTADRRERAAAR